MEKQIIIALGREFGSGGHFIAQKLSSKLGVKLYDKELLEAMMNDSGYDKHFVEKYDEKPKSIFLSRRVGNYSNSIEEHLAEKIFDFIRQKADEGESFIVVGRCAENVLREYHNCVSIFVLGNIEEKIKRIMQVYDLPRNKATDLLKKTDKKRKLFHNYYSDVKWGDSRGYDISVNSSKLGIDKTVDILADYIESFMLEL